MNLLLTHKTSDRGNKHVWNNTKYTRPHRDHGRFTLLMAIGAITGQLALLSRCGSLPPLAIAAIASHQPAIPRTGDVVHVALSLATRLELLVRARVPVLGGARRAARARRRGRHSEALLDVIARRIPHEDPNERLPAPSVPIARPVPAPILARVAVVGGVAYALVVARGLALPVQAPFPVPDPGDVSGRDVLEGAAVVWEVARGQYGDDAEGTRALGEVVVVQDVDEAAVVSGGYDIVVPDDGEAAHCEQRVECGMLKTQKKEL